MIPMERSTADMEGTRGEGRRRRGEGRQKSASAEKKVTSKFEFPPPPVEGAASQAKASSRPGRSNS